ncbi:hypothetical protein B0H16DRAFT_1882922 [Mycena metata]|uniref:Uncharacterized protein n=1 Tax=Mycena metata TaxID=1033252 RepID=A0AAD7NLK6_9AGAR|nr:hypothetical protein B0H16DRAFT_1882922 [Mycena metata]
MFSTLRTSAVRQIPALHASALALPRPSTLSVSLRANLSPRALAIGGSKRTFVNVCFNCTPPPRQLSREFILTLINPHFSLRPPRRAHTRRVHRPHHLRRLRRRGAPAEGLPESRSRAVRGAQDGADTVLPLRREGTLRLGVQAAGQVLHLWGDGSHPEELPPKPPEG